MSKVFRASRWGRSLRGAPAARRPVEAGRPACGVDDGEGDYLNCPFTKDEYDAFYEALVAAESATVHDFDKAKFFEGCLPIEVMAHRGVDTLRFGPMKPVGPRRSAHRARAVRRRAAAAGQPRRRSLQPGRLPDADEVGRAGARAADDPRARAGRVRALRHGAPQHLHQRADGAARDVADAARPTCSSPARCRASKATWSRRRRGCSPASTPRARAGGGQPRRRRARRPSARWPTTCRTPTRRTTSRPTSRSASCRRSRTRRAQGRARRCDASARWPTSRRGWERRAGAPRGLCTVRSLAPAQPAGAGRCGRRRDSSEASSSSSCAQPQRLAAHRARLRATSRSSSPSAASERGGKRERSCPPRRRPDVPRFSASCTRGRRARRPRGAVGACGRSPLPAARGRHRRRPGGARRRAEARAARCRRTSRRTEMTRAARDARRRARRSAGAIARSSSCSTRRACA
jgi:hypothetical protein